MYECVCVCVCMSVYMYMYIYMYMYMYMYHTLQHVSVYLCLCEMTNSTLHSLQQLTFDCLFILIAFTY